METIEPIEAIVPRRAQAYGEFVRHAAQLARAGLPVPAGYALPRTIGDRFYAGLLATDAQFSALLDPAQPLPSEEEVAALAARITAASLPRDVAAQVSEVFATMRALGAERVTMSAFLVCDLASYDRPLGDVQLGIDSAALLGARLIASFASLYERELIRALRAVAVRSAGVSVLVQRMFENTVAGVLYTRHPVTDDPREWLLRAGYGLSSGVRLGRVPSDVLRITRAGFVRDEVIVDKTHMLQGGRGGAREVVQVAEELVRPPCLTPDTLQEVLKLSRRTEQEVGRPVRIDWLMADGRVRLLRAEPLPGSAKPPRVREPKDDARERTLWSHHELGEALSLPPTPLGWSLLTLLSQGGAANVLAAAGAALGSAPELIIDVRGRPFLNLGVLTEAVSRLPGMSPELLARVGLDLPAELVPAANRGLFTLSRAALRVYDSHVRFGERLSRLSLQMADERGHFAGLDARLLAPEALERVLCDVETFMREVSTALMRVSGNWLATLLALHALLSRYQGADALRSEKALLWGPEELLSAQTGSDFLRLARVLARDSRALSWAEQPLLPPPSFVQEGLDDFALRHENQGMFLLDPCRPRWRETPQRLAGVMRALLADPMTLAFAVEQRAVGKERREHAERAWKATTPRLLWPFVQRLIAHLRALTRQRDRLLLDTAHGIRVIREIAIDASRRLSTRYSQLGPEAAFFLMLPELHAALARGDWDVCARVAMRQTEYQVLSQLPRPSARFYARPGVERALGGPLRGTISSAGTAEGRVFHVRHGDELSHLPRGAVLVLSACDLGLAAVLPAVRAVVSEQGGALSQGAALAHALGVPVVVGVANASERLRAGQRVRVNADACCVEPLA